MSPMTSICAQNRTSRKIVLVALPWNNGRATDSPLGHESLLATLRQEPGLIAHSIISPVNDADFSIDALTQQILLQADGFSSNQIDVGIGAYVWNDRQVKSLLNALRDQGFNGRIILGGPQISYAEEGLEASYPQADVFIRGQGETALRALTRSAKQQEISGVHYAGHRDSLGQAVNDLQALPSPWLNGQIELTGQSSIRWETQRGCTFRCSFCQHRQSGDRAQVALQDKERIRQEIALFCENKVRRISVLDPIFNRDSAHATEVLELFASHGYKGELSLQCRAEMTDSTFLESAKKLDVCLEFGLQSIHPNEYQAIDRPNKMTKVESVLKQVCALGIRHEVSLIYGLPEQTLESFKASVDWCLKMGVQIIKAYPLLLLKGTKLEKEKDRWALKTRDGELPMVESASTFSVQDWEEMARIAQALSNTEGRHPQKVAELLLRAANPQQEAGCFSRQSALEKQ